jgi:hypothetical protein
MVTTPAGGTRVHRESQRARLTVAFVTALVAALGANALLGIHPASASTSTSMSVLANGGFEQGLPQSAWVETQSSGGELIDTIDPHTGAWAADLCDIDNCTDGHGNAGDTLVQPFVDPGQVVSATLSYYYNVATSEPYQNASCKDWLTVGLGTGTVPAAAATKRYCTPTGAQYAADSIDVTSFLQSHGGQMLDAQIEGFTNALNPSEFFVDDVTLSVTYLLTPSAPVVAPITDCSVSQTTLTWSAPQFPLGNQWPVQSYLVTPYNVNGTAQASTSVSGSQTSLAVNLLGGTVCYFTVTATNANGSGPAGAPAAPVTAVTPPSTPQSTGFTLRWALQPASAPATSYTVFIRDGAGPWLKWGDTSATSSDVYGLPGHSYEYYVEGFNAAGGGIAPSGNGQAAVTFPLSATPVMGFKTLYGVDGFGTLHPADSPPLAGAPAFSWQISRGIAVAPSGVGGYVLDGFGAVHPFGNAPAANVTAYWPGWDIARGIAVRSDGSSGYVLDGFGGLHPFGGAPTLNSSAYWPGWDIARGIVLDPSGAGGYVLDGWGGLHPFGNASPVAITGYWNGWDIARGVALRSDGAGGYVLDGFGGVHPFGNAPALATHAYWSGWDIARGLVLLPAGTGGYVADGFGGFHPFGSVSSPAGTPNYRADIDVMRGISGS